VKVVGQNRNVQTVDSEVSCHSFQLRFEPILAVTVILAGYRITAHQKAAPDDAVHDMDRRDLAGVKDFTSGRSTHPAAPLENMGSTT
jgi:hypothetical protein